MTSDRIKSIQWIPFTLLLGGIILRWLKVDAEAILLNVGFITYGVVTFIEGINGGYHKQINAGTFRILVPVITILLAIDNLRAPNEQQYTLLAIALILQFVVTQNKR